MPCLAKEAFFVGLLPQNVEKKNRRFADWQEERRIWLNVPIDIFPLRQFFADCR